MLIKKILLGVLVMIVLMSVGGFIYAKSNWHSDRVVSWRGSACKMIGGEMKESGCGIGRCIYECYKAYADAGLPCQSSQACAGKCIVISPKFKEFYVSNWELDPEKVQKSELLQELIKCDKGENNMFNCSALNLKAECQKFKPANCETQWEFDRGIVKPISSQCYL